MKMTSFITPTLPRSLQEHRPPRILCGRKPRRRTKNPPPLQTRPLPRLPPLPKGPPAAPAQPAMPAGCTELLTRTLQSRSDAIVVNSRTYAPIIKALFCRENSEHALILVPTRTNVLDVAGLLMKNVNIPRQSRKTRIIVACGKGGGWKYAAMNANSSKHSVIVVGTPRAIFQEFFNTHGLPWLGRVRFVVIEHVSEMVEIGCVKELCKVVKRIGSARKTVLIENEYNDDIKNITNGWIREKHGIVEWEGEKRDDDDDDDDDDVGMKDSCLIIVGPRRGLEYIIRMVDKRKEGERVVILFPVARVVEIYATILRSLGRNVIDIHSKTSIGNRIRGLESFKQGGIVFGTDTVLDEIKDADMVISIGLVDEELYRKRAKVGKRVIGVVRPEIAGMMKFGGEEELWKGEDIVIDDDLVLKGITEKAKRVGYQSLLSYYVGWRKRVGWNRSEMVEFVNVWAKEMLGGVPEIERRFAGWRRLGGYKDISIIGHD